MIDNDSLGAVLERALDDEPPARGGAEEVFAAATRLRWRRRAWTAAAGVATLGLVAGTVIGIGALTRPSIPAGITPAAPPPASQASTPPVLEATQPAGPAIMETLKTLIHQMPATGSVSKMQTADAENGGTLVYRDQDGRTLLGVTFDADAYVLFSGGKNGPGPDAVTKQFDCAMVLSVAPRGTTCKTGTLAGGARTISVSGPNHGDYTGVQGVRRYVSVLYPSGTMVSVNEWNMADPKRGPVTRSTPAFTLAQIYGLATSEAWLKL